MTTIWYNFGMNNKDLAKKITAKDEKTALGITKKMIDEADSRLFNELAEQSEYLYPFVVQNVVKRLEMSICKANYENLISFFDCYSPYYDKVFASAIKVFGDDLIKNKMYDFMKNGSVAQKTYAARYFEQAKDIFAVRELIANAFSEDEYLADACAAALGALNEQKSYQIALAKLNSEDDFEALSALNFFVNYIKNPPLEDIFNAMKKSGMPENFAGKIAALMPLPVLIKENTENALCVIDNIINGFGEILPISEVFDFDLYDVIGILSENTDEKYASQIAVVLLKAKSKIEMICSNDEYTFDEDKNTKQELKEIQGLLNSFGEKFWSNLKKNIEKELNTEKSRAVSALEVIQEYSLTEYVPQILELIYESDNETLICKAFEVLKSLNALSYIAKEDALSNFTNETLKAIVENYYC